MNLESETTKELNMLTPLMDIINSVLSLNNQQIFKSKNFSEETNLFTSESDINFCFKVLILDDSSFKTLSPLLKQATLQKHNICLITKINAQKDPMHSMMSIYLVTPTSENFRLILNDMKNNIYKNYSINFIEKPDDNLLEEFLTDIIKLDIYKNIYNLHVLPIKYSLIHPKIIDFCSLDTKIVKPYTLFNQNLNDKITESYYDLIANMLFNVLFCMKISPLIKYKSSSFSELIVEKIQNKFISTFNKFPELKNEFKNGNCLMVILERDFLDLPIMLHHSSSFGAIISDILGLTFEQENYKKIENQKFSLDPLNDFIWNKNISRQYNEVLEDNLNKYQKHKQKMEIFDICKEKNNSEKLQKNSEQIIEGIKEIDKRKLEWDVLEKHAQITIFLNKLIVKRELSNIFSIEKQILDKRDIDKEINKDINKFVEEGKIKNENYLDVFRLCLIYYLIDKDNLNDDLIKNVIQKLNLPSKYNSKIILDYLYLIKNDAKSFSSQELINRLNTENQQNKTMLGQVGGFSKKLFKKGFNFIKRAVNNLKGNYTPALAMDILYDLIYEKNKYQEQFTKLQLNKNVYIPDESKSKNLFLFVLGGGSLNEFEYCKEFADNNGYNFIYGADKIYSPNEFLDELSELANQTMKDIKI